jgi:hypothetical protein
MARSQRPVAERTLKLAPVPSSPRRLAEALAVPLHADVFDALCWLANGTVPQLCQFLGHPAREIEGAVARLVEADVIEPIGPRPAAPGEPVAYRTTRDGLITDEEWAEFPPELRRRLLGRQVDKMYERMRDALNAGGFDPPDVHLSWMPADLDGIGYQDMVRLMEETLNRARDIQVATVERRAAGSSDGEEIKTSVMLLHFLEPPGAADGPEPKVLERMKDLSAYLTGEVPAESPDWERIAESATTLAALARRRAAASVVR